MKILFYQDIPSLNSTLLTWTLIEELRLRGHMVDYGKPDPKFNLSFDWVHGSGADSWPALNYARKMGSRCHIHLEGVPYWRIGYENAIDWGYDQNHTPEEIKEYRRHYGSWMSTAFLADSCTVNGANQVKAIEWMFEAKLPNCHLISCGADARFALTLPDWPKLNYMVTVSRLEPNKKVFLIAKALALLVDQGIKVPPWMIIGYGTKEQFNKIHEICKGKIEIWWRFNYGAAKWRWIKRARMMLCGWSGIPPAEGILCKVPALSFNHPDIIEMYEDTIWWAHDNSIENYANRVKWLLEKTKPAPETGVPEWTKVSQKTVHALNRLTGRLKFEGQPELYACTQEQAAEHFEKIFMEGMGK
uniref:Putative glycosyltransferase n=1 Tax=viral metagenome TaxID=1070528 RepID=A0A6M3LPF5_9ZZZZ